MHDSFWGSLQPLLVSDGLLADSAFRSFHGRFMPKSDSQTQLSYFPSKFRSSVGRVLLSSRLRRGYEDHTSPVSLFRGVKEPLWHSQPSEGRWFLKASGQRDSWVWGVAAPLRINPTAECSELCFSSETAGREKKVCMDKHTHKRAHSYFDAGTS